MKGIIRFKKTIWEYYHTYGRHDLLWRKTRDLYKILVSEIMLQQTQVSRVIVKYTSFLKQFPTVNVLALAPLSHVLKEWQGLGYNRRAKYLKMCAEKIMSEHGGKFPKTFAELVTLPGIGPATAGDILAFAYNIPVPLIETNIRSVYIHFFFADMEKVSDKEILPIIEHTLDMKNPREWYWALFDYGAKLKERKNHKQNLNKKSTHYTKQSPFIGSNRQKRSAILKLILQSPHTESQLIKTLGYPAEMVQKNLSALEREGMIKKSKQHYFIK